MYFLSWPVACDGISNGGLRDGDCLRRHLIGRAVELSRFGFIYLHAHAYNKQIEIQFICMRKQINESADCSGLLESPFFAHEVA